LVVVESSTNRRRIAAHERLFARLTLRGSAALAWLRHPTGAPTGVLLFRASRNHNMVGVRRAGRQRVRHAQRCRAWSSRHFPPSDVAKAV
jgi:hypothetical protein